MQAFIEFGEGILRMPMHWQVWVMLLGLMNLFIPVLFFRSVRYIGGERHIL